MIERLFVGVGVMLLASCESPRAAPTVPPLFERIAPAVSGISFENTLPEAPEFNILNYLYYYNGGGVAVGDVDGDGLQDLYLTSNLGENRLYRNLGNFRFEDITAKAGVAGAEGWTTGAAMADVNGDGKIDLFVSGVRYLTMQGRNILYVNNGNGSFTDRTEEYGLSFAGFSTQATFFDYDGDGDLDMYLLNHSVHTERQIGVAARGGERHPVAGDRLYRNDGGRFTDVSAAAGVYGSVEGYGLGVMATDLNGDGCPDLYIANDFQENDFYYVNRCDGTFVESITTATGHTSRFSMGVDAADMNNDGRPDVMVVDMLPEQEAILKSSASSESANLFEMRLRAGYHPQYPRNTLQLNLGGNQFSEIAQMAGVFASDWSWAPLFADLDDDGQKDLFITNGIYRRPNDLDYINYVGNEAVQASLANGVSRENLTLLQRMPQIPLPNHAYQNTGALGFVDRAQEWGLAEKGFSNGAAYVDLDNDGALDLVVNRINASAALYRNRARTERPGHHWLTVQLAGRAPNTLGVGTTVVAVTGATRQTVQQQPVRGFQSSVDPRLHFGLGAAATVDSLLVIWPDRRMQILTGVSSDRLLTVSQDSATERWQVPASRAPRAEEVSVPSGLAVPHVENDFLDYNREPLMPHGLSTEGPGLAVGDLNGDGLDDVFVGGAKWQSGHVMLQQRDGRFAASAQPALLADSLAEDVDAQFFDADSDGDLDLYVVSGGNEFFEQAPALKDRLYLNDGRGTFARSVDALPADYYENGGVVTVGDLDGDGHPDLFVGARVVSRQYGRIPRSAVLRNDGRGRFTDVTASVAPALASVGMVSDAAWVDLNGDRMLDLVVVGEWMPVRVFMNRAGKLAAQTNDPGLAHSSGWWNSLTVADLNGDGAPDLVLGNLGLNAYVKSSTAQPAQLFVNDFASTGTPKAILTFYKFGVRYPVAGRDDLVKLMPTLRSKYPSYAAFGASRLEDIFTTAEVRAATVYEAQTFASTVALNDGTGRFTLQPLPAEAQVAPVYASLAADFTGDGHMDLLVGGNQYTVPPMLGRYDASHGTLLIGDGSGHFKAADIAAGAIRLDGQIRGLRRLKHASGVPYLVVARNNATLQLFRLPASRWN